MGLRCLPWDLRPELVVRVQFGIVNVLLMRFLGVLGLRANQEAQYTHDCLFQGRFLELVRVRRIEKSCYSVGSLGVMNRKNRTMSLGEGTGWEVWAMDCLKTWSVR